MESDFADLQVAKELIRGFTNATSDILPFVALKGVMDGSPLAAISLASNVIIGAFRTFLYGATGNFDGALESSEKLMDTFGVWRAGKSFSELVFEEEVRQQNKAKRAKGIYVPED